MGHKMVKAKLAGMPKRPMSAYFLWMNDVGRAQVKKSNPNASITEVSKECGVAWQNIDPATKAKYEKKKEEAKKTFDKEYAAWLADGGEELLAQQKKDKKAGRNLPSLQRKPRRKRRLSRLKTRNLPPKLKTVTIRLHLRISTSPIFLYECQQLLE